MSAAGSRADCEELGTFPEENYRGGSYGEEFYRELHALKAWLRGDAAEAVPLSQEALRKASAAGAAALGACLALNERKEAAFRKALDARLKAHASLLKTRPVPPIGVVCWAGLMLARFAREIGWNVFDQTFLPVALLNE